MNNGGLVGPAEVAARAGVKRGTVDRWRMRHESFPTPIAELHMGPVWKWCDIAAWLRDTGRSEHFVENGRSNGRSAPVEKP